MTTFAERLAALPKYPHTLSDMPVGDPIQALYGLSGGLLFRQRNALDARLRLAVELLEDVVDAKASEAIFWGKADTIPEIQAYQDLRTRFGLQNDARALLVKIKGELG